MAEITKARWLVDPTWPDGTVWDLRLNAIRLGFVLREYDGRFIAMCYGLEARRHDGFADLRDAGKWLVAACGAEVAP